MKKVIPLALQVNTINNVANDIGNGHQHTTVQLNLNFIHACAYSDTRVFGDSCRAFLKIVRV